MRTFAIICLVVWGIATAVFSDWKKHVAYPVRTFPVRLTGAMFEFLFVALALWVVIDGG